MAETYTAEGRKIIRKLLEQAEIDFLDVPKDVSKNKIKKLRRALGAVLFSPDAVGYIDLIDKELTAGKNSEDILERIYRRSEKFVGSYSFAPGIFEAHHVVPLSVLRDNYLRLSDAEQDEFIKRLNDSGWELGDSPKQLMNTVQSRHVHQFKGAELKKGGDPAKIQYATNPAELGLQESSTSHYNPATGKVATNFPAAKGATTGEELFTQFQKISKTVQVQAALGNISDDALRQAILAEHGFDIYEISPELNKELYAPDGKRRQILATGAEVQQTQGFRPTSENLERLAGTGFEAGDPQGLQKLAMDLRGFKDDAAKIAFGTTRIGRAARLAGVTTLPGAFTLPASAKAFDEAKKAREQDPSLRNRALEIATGMQVAGDTLDVSGTALTATVAGAPVGVPMSAVGGAISNVGAVAEQVITAPEAYQRSTEAVSERTGKTEEEVRADPLGYGALFNTVKDKLGQIGLSGFNPMQSAFN